MDKVKPTLTKYSNSMVESYLSCRKRFEYAHVDALQRKISRSKNENQGANFGSDGHAFLEEFFRQIKAGHDDRVAFDLALKMVVDDGRSFEAMDRAFKWIKEQWPKLNWEILEVEKSFSIPVGDDLFFTGKIDLIVRNRDNNKVYVVDHKFLYNLYGPELTSIMAQMAKYAGAMQIMGLKVDGAYYNMLRSRRTEKEPWRMDELTLSPQRIREAIETQVMVTREIAEGFVPYRNATKPNCEYCYFKILCEAEVHGRSTEVIREIEYEKNSYNYNDGKK